MRFVRVRLNRYIISEIIGPLGLGFLVYTFILLLRFLFQSAEMIIRRGLAVSVVGKLLLVSLPNIVVLTLPMSLLFAILIAIGRLSSDSELIAMRSSGISLLSLYRPVLLLSAVFTVLNTLLMVEVLPWGNHSLQQLRLEIATQTMNQQVEPRVFYQEWADKTLYVFDAPPPGKHWKGIFLAESVPNTQQSQITMADSGEVRVDPSGELVILHLTNAFRHSVDLHTGFRYEINHQKELDVVLEDQFSSDQRARISVSKGVRELDLGELWKLRADPHATVEQRNLAAVELHKKFSIPFACLVFGLFALPLGINNRRGGKASGFAISIGVIILYYVMLNNGEEAARFGKFPAWLAMWMPNLLLAAVGLFLLARRNRDKGLLWSRIDRWVRMDVWRRLRWFQSKRRERELKAAAQRGRPAAGVGARPAFGSEIEERRVLLRLPRLRIRFPNLLDRYVGALFTRIFFLVLLSGVALFVIFDLNELIDDILKNKVPLALVLRYYKYLSLQIFYQISPILVLVTTLITFILLARTNEIVACKALGMSLYRLALPAVVGAALITALCGFLESGVLPAANEKVAQAKDRIQGRQTPRSYRRADKQWLFGQGRYIYNYLHYDPTQKSLQRLQVFDFDPAHHLARRLYTDGATYVGGAWVFTRGWARSFQGVNNHWEHFDEPRIVRFPETPSYFDSEIRPPDQMGYRELNGYIEELRDSGQPVPELQVSLYEKVAFPAISFVMALVALPFAFRIGRQGALYGIGLSVILGMFFMAIYAFFTKLGEAGALPPLLAVWSPGTVFAILSVYLFLGVKT
ncbi:MAG TPA: LPS export ABC transporter permease LptF [Thermoanaerobaculia bacterium]|nr:LPS export ABC transporter permease LptF [Thermoanaerobaculia bacterium]